MVCFSIDYSVVHCIPYLHVDCWSLSVFVFCCSWYWLVSSTACMMLLATCYGKM